MGAVIGVLFALGLFGATVSFARESKVWRIPLAMAVLAIGALAAGLFVGVVLPEAGAWLYFGAKWTSLSAALLACVLLTWTALRAIFSD